MATVNRPRLVHGRPTRAPAIDYVSAAQLRVAAADALTDECKRRLGDLEQAGGPLDKLKQRKRPQELEMARMRVNDALLAKAHAEGQLLAVRREMQRKEAAEVLASTMERLYFAAVDNEARRMVCEELWTLSRKWNRGR